jgi:hypothetical protein
LGKSKYIFDALTFNTNLLKGSGQAFVASSGHLSFAEIILQTYLHDTSYIKHKAFLVPV